MTLEHLNVLVTRPSPQGEKLCELINAANGNAFFFPTLEIHSLTETIEFKNRIQHLSQFDWLIFISPQAVHQSAEFIKPCLSQHHKIAAIGGSTASALTAIQLPVHIYPKKQWESEGLLSLPELTNISGKKIALIKGEGGRTLLADELKQRGASITEIIAYRRVLPNFNVSTYLNLLKQDKINIIICTSNEVLENLIILLGAEKKLYQVPLIVISSRMAEFAKSKHFSTILLAENASHEAIMTILKDHVCQMKLNKHL